MEGRSILRDDEELMSHVREGAPAVAEERTLPDPGSTCGFHPKELFGAPLGRLDIRPQQSIEKGMTAGVDLPGSQLLLLFPFFLVLQAAPSHGSHDVIVLFLGPLPPEGGCARPQALQLAGGKHHAEGPSLSPSAVRPWSLRQLADVCRHKGNNDVDTCKGKRCTENPKKCANAVPVKSLERVRGPSVQDANSPGKNGFSHQHGSELSTSVPAIGTFRFFHRDVSVGAMKKPPEKKNRTSWPDPQISRTQTGRPQ